MGYYKNYSRYRRTEAKPRKEVPDFSKRLEKILQHESLLDNWSKDFLESLRTQYAKHSGLTDGQIGTLKKIEAKVSPDALQAASDWKEEYHSQWETKAKVVAEYYLASGEYWNDLAIKIKAGGVPARGPFMKMAGNKYAQAVVAAHEASPRFDVDSIAQLRANTNVMGKLRNVMVMIIRNDLVPHRSAKSGTKRYVVLPLGASDTQVVDEGDLMKKNKNGKVYVG